MNMIKWLQYAIIPVVALLVIGLYVYDQGKPEQTATAPTMDPTPAKTIPDFASFKDVKQKKKAFFNYMLPRIRNANAEVVAERELALELEHKVTNGGLSDRELEQLSELFEKYRVRAADEPDQEELAILLRRVDVVPASLILAQAANESAWGTSRFARRGYNFFGIWCFEPGCGLAPKYRDDGLTHEVARFESVADGVHYYLYTINTNRAYRGLREIREQLREDGERVTGIKLAEGLVRYSERGTEYVDEIQSMIDYNNLSDYSLDTTQLAARDM